MQVAQQNTVGAMTNIVKNIVIQEVLLTFVLSMVLVQEKPGRVGVSMEFLTMMIFVKGDQRLPMSCGLMMNIEKRSLKQEVQRSVASENQGPRRKRGHGATLMMLIMKQDQLP